jgi:electron transfer flavoprotein beta subunit
VNVLVCAKRVPQTGGRIVLTADGQAIDTKFLGFTISPHEECGVEEAVRIVEARGGSSTVLTLGPAAAEEQLRDAMALGIERAVLLETDGSEWDPVSTAAAIAGAIRAQEAANGAFDLIVFGNESADSGGFQVGIRVAVALGRPVVTGLKGLELGEGRVTARREAPGGGWETYELPLPAVVGVKEGINLPRYPSVPGRLRAKKKEVERVAVGAASGGPAAAAGTALGPSMVVLRLPEEQRSEAEVVGRGPEAAPAVVDLLERIGVLGVPR